jgi:hypothetical protein
MKGSKERVNILGNFSYKDEKTEDRKCRYKSFTPYYFLDSILDLSMN